MKSLILKATGLFILIASLIAPVPTLAASGDDEFEFKGTIESLPADGLIGDWTVAGRIVHVTSSTRLNQQRGSFAVGVLVEVEGRVQADGSVTAKKIKVEDADDDSGDDGGSDDRGGTQFKGTIESFPPQFIGDWMIGGRTVRVTAQTKIEQEFGPVAVGAFVEVKGSMQSDGVFVASKIEVKSNVMGGDGRDELKGTIESLPAGGFIGDWVVSGRTVHVSDTTVINQEHGVAVVGASVEIHGTLRTDSSLDAARIEVKPSSPGSGGSGGEKANFKGTIEALPADGLIGDWTISGTVVHVTSSTRIKQEHGATVVGAGVKVKGTRRADGSIDASRIQVRDSF